MALLSASSLTLFHGDVEIFSDITVDVQERARIGIVGPNGSGKTSFITALAGETEATSGDVNRARGVRIGYVSQAPVPMVDGTLLDEIMLAFAPLLEMEREMAHLTEAMGSLPPAERQHAEGRYASLQHEYQDGGGYTYQNELERAVAGVGLSPETLATPSASSSGGERTRAALARALLAQPDVLVLDEPTNHLDLAGLTWLEKFLNRFPYSFIVVSHDRYFLDRVATQIWEIDRGRLRAFAGNYTRYREQKAERTLTQRREFEKQQVYIAKEEDFIRRFRAGQRAQEAQGRETRLKRLERIEAPPEDQTFVRMQKLTTSRTTQVVLNTRGLKVGFATADGMTSLLEVPDLRLERGSRTGIIGSNGAGKTTLLNTLLGLIPPVAGTVNLGANVKLGYHRQGLEDLPGDSSVLEALLETKPMTQGEARSYLARFLFRGEDVYQKVRVLSGGERGRLALARLLISQPNVLCLDEPTNHLDISSREALEEVLQTYDGTLLFVSHDRQLVSLLADQLWVVENGRVNLFPGTFAEWVESREEASPTPKAKKRAPPRAERPKKDPSVKALALAAKRVTELEERLKEIEDGLAKAASTMDISAISRLGEEHKAVQTDLNRAWEQLAG